MTTLNKIFLLLNKEQKKRLYWTGLLTFLGIIIEMLGVGLIYPAISIIFSDNLETKYPSLNKLFYFINIPNKNELVIISFSFLLVFYFFKEIFLYFIIRNQSKFSTRLSSELSQKLFKQYLYMPYINFTNSNSAILLRNIQGDIFQMTSVTQAILSVIMESFIIFGILSFLVYLNPKGVLLLCILTITTIILFNSITKKKLLIFGQTRQDSSFKMNKAILEGLNGIKDVKIFNKELFFLNKYNHSNDTYANLNSKVLLIGQVPRLFLEFLSIFLLFVFIIILFYQQKSINEIMPILSFFLISSFKITPSINKIISSIQTIKFATPIIDNIHNEFTLTKYDITKNIESDIYLFENGITIKGLDFKYPNTQKIILNNLNLSIEKGTSVAFIGKSGVGKSTLLDLLTGLLKPTNGSIYLDDFKINTESVSWKNLIGYVPQNVFLTDDTIRNNIAFGCEDIDINDQLINKALIDSNLDKFINSLPLGLNTFIGEKGVKISGGQKQRIGIARALYRNPEILIFDEATSALDTETENLIIESINSLKRKKTIIIVAHRKSTIENCDIIYELDNGAVIKKD